MHEKSLPGCPDFVFVSAHLAVFVDGCFWHGCPICKRTMPATNATFWRSKIQRNKSRDVIVGRQLRTCGIRVLRLWEHELRGTVGLEDAIRRLTLLLRKDKWCARRDLNLRPVG